jgi:hypothetical protein
MILLKNAASDRPEMKKDGGLKGRAKLEEDPEP